MHFGDVADWDASQAMIQTAVDTFGGLDILVNNAGFLRDKMIFSMSEADFDAVMRVHVKGHFCGIRHATAYWREQSKAKAAPIYGRIISYGLRGGDLRVGRPAQLCSGQVRDRGSYQLGRPGLREVRRDRQYDHAQGPHADGGDRDSWRPSSQSPTRGSTPSLPTT